jgi:hypothetical protein
MADIEAFIWHDHQGKIVAVGYPTPGCKEKIEPLAKSNHKVLKLRVPEEHLRTLHLTHAIDIEKSTLCSRPGTERR